MKFLKEAGLSGDNNPVVTQRDLEIQEKLRHLEEIVTSTSKRPTDPPPKD